MPLLIYIKRSPVWCLRFIFRAASMRAMFRSKTTRRWLASVVGIVLALCQSLAIANACTTAVPWSGLGAVEEACHDFTVNEGRTAYDNTGEPHCESQRASIASVGVIVPAAVPLPAFNARVESGGMLVASLSLEDYALGQAAPVPLNLIHCRLLN